MYIFNSGDFGNGKSSIHIYLERLLKMGRMVFIFIWSMVWEW